MQKRMHNSLSKYKKVALQKKHRLRQAKEASQNAGTTNNRVYHMTKTLVRAIGARDDPNDLLSSRCPQICASSTRAL